MENFLGMKEMYDVNIRLNSPIDVAGRHYDVNETLLSFSQVEIAQISENKIRQSATGGYNNNLLIDWETDKEAVFAIKHGILSPVAWAALSNSKIKKDNKKSIQFQEKLKTVEENNVWACRLTYIPNATERMGIQGNPENEPLPMGRKEWLPLKPLPPARDKFIFCYDCQTGQRIMKFEIIGNLIVFKAEHNEVMIDYTFDYNNPTINLEVGNRLFNGFLNLSGKITAKDYRTGEPKTAILEIPRLKMRSSLGIQLGTSLDCATVSDFTFIGYPEEGRLAEQSSICSITFLDSELTGDYV